jgi:hypothetical protein
MKKSLIISMLFVLAACSGTQQENKDVTAKKAELEKLTKDRDALSEKITALESEILKLGGSFNPPNQKLDKLFTLDSVFTPILEFLRVMSTSSSRTAAKFISRWLPFLLGKSHEPTTKSLRITAAISFSDHQSLNSRTLLDFRAARNH